MGTLGHAKKLDFENCDWDDDDAAALARTLCLAQSVKVLMLRGNTRIGVRGYQALAAAIAAGDAPNLERVYVPHPHSDAVAGLRTACEARPLKWTACTENTHILVVNRPQKEDWVGES